MLTAERTKEILCLYIKNDYDELDNETVYCTLTNWCGCTDEELQDLGLGYLIPPSEEKLRVKIDRIYTDILLRGLDENDEEVCRKAFDNLRKVFKSSLTNVYETKFSEKVKSAYAEFCKFYNEQNGRLDVEKIKRLLAEALEVDEGSDNR